MIRLCSKCLPEWERCEVHTVIPIMECQGCGATDNRHKGGPVVHLLPSDPREQLRQAETITN